MISSASDLTHFFLIQSTIMSVNQCISILHQLPHSRLMAKDPLWCSIFFHLTANCTGHLSHSVSSLTLSLLGCQSKQRNTQYVGGPSSWYLTEILIRNTVCMYCCLISTCEFAYALKVSHSTCFLGTLNTENMP